MVVNALRRLKTHREAGVKLMVCGANVVVAEKKRCSGTATALKRAVSEGGVLSLLHMLSRVSRQRSFSCADCATSSDELTSQVFL